MCLMIFGVCSKRKECIPISDLIVVICFGCTVLWMSLCTVHTDRDNNIKTACAKCVRISERWKKQMCSLNISSFLALLLPQHRRWKEMLSNEKHLPTCVSIISMSFCSLLFVIHLTSRSFVSFFFFFFLYSLFNQTSTSFLSANETERIPTPCCVHVKQNKSFWLFLRFLVFCFFFSFTSFGCSIFVSCCYVQYFEVCVLCEGEFSKGERGIEKSRKKATQIE